MCYFYNANIGPLSSVQSDKYIYFLRNCLKFLSVVGYTILNGVFYRIEQKPGLSYVKLRLKRKFMFYNRK